MNAPGTDGPDMEGRDLDGRDMEGRDMDRPGTNDPATAPPGDGHAGDLVSAHLDGELAPDVAAWVDDHLERCAPCRDAAADAGHVRRRIRELPPVDGAPVIAGFLARHRAVIRTGVAFVCLAALGLGALAATSAVLSSPVVPPVELLADIHRLAGSDAPGASSADPMAGMQRVDGVGAPYAAPQNLPGHDGPLSRRAVYDGDDLTLVVYGDGRAAISVFEQPGHLEWDRLPAGRVVTVDDREVWLGGEAGATAITEVGDVVVTVVSDDPALLTAAVEGLPAMRRDSTWDRIHDACARLTRAFAGQG